MNYVDKMLEIPYDKYDGINVQAVEQLCVSADEEVAELKEWQRKAFQCYPNIDCDIENLTDKEYRK